MLTIYFIKTNWEKLKVPAKNDYELIGMTAVMMLCAFYDLAAFIQFVNAFGGI